MKVSKGYCFDDVLLVPKHSEVVSRDKVDLSVELPRGLIGIRYPFVTANMKTVTGVKMANAIQEYGGLAILHRFYDVPSMLIDDFRRTEWKDDSPPAGYVGASVGIKNSDFEIVERLVSYGCRIICVDVAHGDHGLVSEFINRIRYKHQNIVIIGGNVCTEAGANLLWEAGADIIKVGIGGGSLCSTRIETGNGYPQLSALDIVCNGTYKSRDPETTTPPPHRYVGHMSYAADGGFTDPLFIADGGIRYAGDCAKALCFADMVMIGNLFAGTDESPGEIIIQNSRKLKQYAGSSTYKPNHVEGVTALVPYKGPVKDVINHLKDGITSNCSYQGVSNLHDLKINPEFVEISNAGLVESHPHDVVL